jgi:hypothetical protein
LIGLNNPSLLCEYHRLGIPANALYTDDPLADISDGSYNPRGLVPHYGFGRLFLASAYIGMNGSVDMLQESPGI